MLPVGLSKTNPEGFNVPTHAKPLQRRGVDEASRSNSSPLGRGQGRVPFRRFLRPDSTDVCRTQWPVREIIAGLLFGVAFEMKLVNVILLPLAALIVWQRCRTSTSPTGNVARSLLILAASLAVSSMVTDYLVDGGAYVKHFQQSWTSHFAATKSFEYGSPADRPFDWSVPLKNRDTSLPAMLGIVFSLRQVRKIPALILPLAWLALTFAVFASHRPWWPYYYIHNAIPLCWCAARLSADLQFPGAETNRAS